MIFLYIQKLTVWNTNKLYNTKFYQLGYRIYQTYRRHARTCIKVHVNKILIHHLVNQCYKEDHMHYLIFFKDIMSWFHKSNFCNDNFGVPQVQICCSLISQVKINQRNSGKKSLSADHRKYRLPRCKLVWRGSSTIQPYY